MDTTIRNLDATTYQRIKVHAAVTGRRVGDVVTDAMREYLERHETVERTGTLADVPVFDMGPGTERLSEQVDEILYGWKR